MSVWTTILGWIKPASSVAASSASGVVLGGIPEAIGAVGNAVGEVARDINQKTALNNTPAMQSSVEKQKQKDVESQISKEVQENDDSSDINNRISP